MDDLLASLRHDWDYIVLDCAPLLPVSDSVPIVSKVDGVVIAVRLYHSRSDAVRRARVLVDRAKANVLGLAVAVPSSQAQPYGYGYGYGPGDADDGQNGTRAGRGAAHIKA
jgi:Mrp family chromosome partitioning ATPase